MDRVQRGVLGVEDEAGVRVQLPKFWAFAANLAFDAMSSAAYSEIQGSDVMTAVFEFCAGGDQKQLSAGELLLREGERSGQLYVLMDGQIEVLKGETVVASIVEPGAIFGEMSILLDREHSANVRAVIPTTVYVLRDAASLLRDRPQLVFLIAQLLARRLSMATTYLADIKQQYAGQGNHLALVADLLQSMINLPPSEISPGSDLQSDPRI